MKALAERTNGHAPAEASALLSGLQSVQQQVSQLQQELRQVARERDEARRRIAELEHELRALQPRAPELLAGNQAADEIARLRQELDLYRFDLNKDRVRAEVGYDAYGRPLRKRRKIWPR